MLLTIKLTPEQTDDIIITDLRCTLEKLVEDGNAEDHEYVVAFERVLDWYGG